MKAYERVHVRGDADPHNELDRGFLRGLTPVCVEVRDTSMSLVDYVHPEDAVYVFGPEDGTLGKGITTACHEFIRIPTVGCLNLSAAVNVVLYDRMAKQTKTAEALLYEMHRREHGELMGA
jgi:tRNA(Leu) C34 or U34 (ribose-2'-O)-methylase TrmL